MKRTEKSAFRERGTYRSHIFGILISYPFGEPFGNRDSMWGMIFLPPAEGPKAQCADSCQAEKYGKLPEGHSGNTLFWPYFSAVQNSWWGICCGKVVPSLRFFCPHRNRDSMGRMRPTPSCPIVADNLAHHLITCQKSACENFLSVTTGGP